MKNMKRTAQKKILLSTDIRRTSTSPFCGGLVGYHLLAVHLNQDKMIVSTALSNHEKYLERIIINDAYYMQHNKLLLFISYRITI